MSPSPEARGSVTRRRSVESLAIQHILSELMKCLQCVTPSKQANGTNRMNIPHGMFGLSLRKFYERRNVADQSYLDALRIVCGRLLQDDKNCIVLDDIHDLIRQLAQGQLEGDLEPAYREIREAVRLLGIQDEIATNLENSTKEYAKLDSRLKNFQFESVRREQALDLKRTAVMIQVSEERRVLAPLEYRYIVNFSGNTEPCECLCKNKEQIINNALVKVNLKHNREIYCTTSVRHMLGYQINDLKRRLVDMEEKFRKDYDEINSMVGYLTSSIESLESRKRECKAKLVMFAEELPVLIEWHKDWEEQKAEKKRQEFLSLMSTKKKKKGKGKEDETKT